MWGNFAKTFKEVGKEALKEITKGDKKGDEKPKVIDNIAVEQITHKISTPVIEANLRLVASASNRSRAEEILESIESSFNQFENSSGPVTKFLTA